MTGLWRGATRLITWTAVGWATAALAQPPPGGQTAPARKRPNFVFILGEGHGWSSTSVRMDDDVPESRSAYVRTPNFERLAKAGMRFASFYAPSPRCTPSRAGYLTGVNPARLHMTFVGIGQGEGRDSDPGARLITPRVVLELPASTTTLPELLKGAGYATAHFGKWHLGRISPSRHGFDENDGATSNGGPDNVQNPHPKQLYGMTERGLDFMRRQVGAGRPFFLQLSHYASRRGADASPEAQAAVRAWGANLDERRRGEAAADVDLDIALGRLLAGIDELGVASETYVIYTADHGSPGRNSPLNGGKGTLFEGGLRVPLIVRGPGVAAGSSSRVRAIGTDLLPTVCALADIRGPLPETVEGGSLVPLLLGKGQGTVRRPRDEHVVHFPHYDSDMLGPASAILQGGLKLIHEYETGATRLYDLARDPGERRDLSREMSARARELDRRLREDLVSVGAQFPSPNPDYDPSRVPTTKQDRRQQRGRQDRATGARRGGRGRRGEADDRP